MRLPVSTLALAAALFIATSAQGKPCLIDLALCGYATAGDASWMINLNDAFVMESPHSYVQMQDGMWEADILLKGKGTAEMCVALWYGSGEQCPYSTSDASQPRILSGAETESFSSESQFIPGARLVTRKLNAWER